MKTIPIVLENRKCDGCTKCCEGWLSGISYGYEFFRGRKCFFLAEKSCSIYLDRPEDPCKKFNCAWLIDNRIPFWMKPNKINAIVKIIKLLDIEYIELIEAGDKLDVEVLSWFVQEYANGKWNTIVYTIENETNFITKNNEWERIKSYQSHLNTNMRKNV